MSIQILFMKWEESGIRKRRLVDAWIPYIPIFSIGSLFAFRPLIFVWEFPFHCNVSIGSLIMQACIDCRFTICFSILCFFVRFSFSPQCEFKVIDCAILHWIGDLGSSHAMDWLICRVAVWCHSCLMKNQHTTINWSVISLAVAFHCTCFEIDSCIYMPFFGYCYYTQRPFSVIFSASWHFDLSQSMSPSCLLFPWQTFSHL